MDAQLQAFILAKSRERFAYGASDCGLLVADWWQWQHGIDPAAHLRGTYGTEDACAALLRGKGGLLRVVARIARAAGAKRVSEARQGCFGVVRYQGAHHGAVATSDKNWAIRGEGLVITRLCRPVAIWE